MVSLCLPKSNAVRLLMYINKNLVDSIVLEPEKIVLPGYVSGFIRELREKHQQLINQTIDEPEFLVQPLSNRT